MKFDISFIRAAAISFGGLALAAALFLTLYATAEVTRSVVAGGLLSLVHLTLGYIAIELGFEKSHTKFLKIVIGGMVARLFLMLAIFLVLVRFFHYDLLWLTLTLLALYMVNLTLEIFHLQKRVSTKHPTLQP
jgi:hypothetical protein